MKKSRKGLATSESRRLIDEELEHHFTSTIAELVADGMSEEDALREAERRFGPVDRHTKRMERIDNSGKAWSLMLTRIELLFTELTRVFRSVSREPLILFTIVITLGLGIGINTTMFGVVDNLLVQVPPGINEADDVHRLYVRRAFRGNYISSQWVTNPDLRDWDEAQSLSSVAGFYHTDILYISEARTSQIHAGLVSPSFFRTMGALPWIGSTIDQADVSDSYNVMLGHSFWRQEFGADSAVLGRSVRIGLNTYTVVGVTEPGFRGLSLQTVDVWLPYMPAGNEFMGDTWQDDRGYYWLEPVVRLAAGVSEQAAAQELTQLLLQGRAEDPYEGEALVQVEHLLVSRGPRGGQISGVTKWVAGISIAVLFVAIANVANILLVRGMRRQTEIGVKLALGVSRRRLAASLTLEGILFAGMGAVAGLAGSYLATELLAATVIDELPNSILTTRTLLFVLAATLITGLASGIGPALKGSNVDLASSIKSGARATGGSGTRNLLTAFQVCLSAVLLFGAGLFLKSIEQIESIELGLDAEQMIEAGYDRSASSLSTEEWAPVLEMAAERLRATGVVEAATPVRSYPFGPSFGFRMRVPGLDSLPRAADGGPYVNMVGDSYFETSGTAILSGRALNERDDAGAPKVAVLSKAMADAYWPGENPLGKCIIVELAEEACFEVVGIAQNTLRQNLTTEDVPHMYFMRYAQMEQYPSKVLVRFRGDRATALDAVRGVLESVAPEHSIAEVATFADIIGRQSRTWRIGAVLLSTFGLLALAVTAVGLYSLISYGVEQRRMEFGIRAAMGATPSKLASFVVKGSFLVAGAGIVVGSVVALLVAPMSQDLLYNVNPRDPGLLAGVFVTLLFIAAGSALVPALRATRVDPTTALRAE